MWLALLAAAMVMLAFFIVVGLLAAAGFVFLPRDPD
jgi:hypothetical protein